MANDNLGKSQVVIFNAPKYTVFLKVFRYPKCQKPPQNHDCKKDWLTKNWWLEGDAWHLSGDANC